MTIYRFYLILPLIVGGISQFFENKKKVFLTLNAILMFLFFALKSKNLIAGDSSNYYNMWIQFSQIPFSSDGLVRLLSYDLEPGFLITSWILSQVFHDGQFIFVFSSIVYTICITKFVSDNCEDYTLSMLVFNGLALTSFMMQALRQSVAISICLLAIPFCRKRKLIPFSLIVLVAMSFHSSAALFIIVFFLYGIELNWKSILLTIVAFFSSSFILARITVVANYLMNESYVGGHTEHTSGGFITMALYLILILYCFVVNYAETDSSFFDDGTLSYPGFEKKDYVHAFFCLVVCATFFSMRFYYITVFERGCYYFLPFAPIALCGTFSRFEKRSKTIMKFIFYFLFLILVLYKSDASAPMSSYTFFWNG